MWEFPHPDRMGCGNVGGVSATSGWGVGMLEVAVPPPTFGGATHPHRILWECWRCHLTGWGVGMLEVAVPPPTWGVGMLEVAPDRMGCGNVGGGTAT